MFPLGGWSYVTVDDDPWHSVFNPLFESLAAFFGSHGYLFFLFCSTNFILSNSSSWSEYTAGSYPSVRRRQSFIHGQAVTVSGESVIDNEIEVLIQLFQYFG